MIKRVHFLAIAICCFSICINAQPNAIEWQHCYGGSDGESVSEILPASDGGYYMIATSASNNGDVPNNYGSADGIVMKTDALGNLVWVKNYGGSLWDEFTSGAITSDGGLIIVGHTTSQDGDIQHPLDAGQDIWLVKLDSDGNIQWEKTFDNAYHDEAHAVIITEENHYVLCGHYSVGFQEHHAKSGVIMKIDTDGAEIWSQSYASEHRHHLLDIIPTSDGNYVACGYIEYLDDSKMSWAGMDDYIYPDAWLIKVDADGETIWSTILEEHYDQKFYALEEPSTGRIIAVGYSNNLPTVVHDLPSIHNALIVSLSADGNQLTHQLINSPNYSELRHIHKHDDDKLFTTGRYSTTNIHADGLLIRLDDDANIIWQHQFGEAVGETASSFVINNDGSCTLAGWSMQLSDDAPPCNESSNFWIIKLSSILKVDTPETPTLSLYPNPATHHITLTGIERGSTITIHDITGKMMHTSTVQDVQTTISTAQLVSGVYTVQVQHDGVIHVQRLVIE